jgi:hypothetical protein
VVFLWPFRLLTYITASSYILWPFGRFCGHFGIFHHFGIFSQFWYVVQRKIWQPWLKTTIAVAKKWLVWFSFVWSRAYSFGGGFLMIKSVFTNY